MHSEWERSSVTLTIVPFRTVYCGIQIVGTPPITHEGGVTITVRNLRMWSVTMRFSWEGAPEVETREARMVPSEGEITFEIPRVHTLTYEWRDAEEIVL